MAETTTAAAVLAGVESIVIEKRPVPSPPAGQVRIRVHSVGICGSDLHYFKARAAPTQSRSSLIRYSSTFLFWSATPRYTRPYLTVCLNSHKQDGKIKGLQIPFPSVDGFKGVMGHECSGTVEELGPGVTELKARITLKIVCACPEMLSVPSGLARDGASVCSGAGWRQSRPGGWHALRDVQDLQGGSVQSVQGVSSFPTALRERSAASGRHSTAPWPRDTCTAREPDVCSAAFNGPPFAVRIILASICAFTACTNYGRRCAFLDPSSRSVLAHCARSSTTLPVSASKFR